MTTSFLVFLTIAVSLVAFLYGSVGHAGASGYIAVLTIAGLAPDVIKPTALIMNILVASLGTWQFWRAGYFSWSLFWPFALLAMPMAFVGGYVNLPVHFFKVLVGVVLLYTAFRFLVQPSADRVQRQPPRWLALLIGAGLGLLSGLTGTGGGIFLTPLLLFKQWAKAKPAAAVSALFILVNSVAGLLGNLSSTKLFPSYAVLLAIGAVTGGFAGAYFGSRRFDHLVIKRMLAGVLLIAGTKLLFT